MQCSRKAACEEGGGRRQRGNFGQPAGVLSNELDARNLENFRDHELQLI